MENVRLFIEDGRSLLSRSPRKYDIISSNAVHARLGANLYTREFYELSHAKLKAGGVICQWLPTNWLSTREFKSLVKAFTDVYPDAALWYINRGHTLLTGSKKADKIKVKESMQLTRGKLREIGIRNYAELTAHKWGDAGSLKKMVENVKPNTDDHPRVEFSTVSNLRPNPDILNSLLELEADLSAELDFSGMDPSDIQSFLENAEILRKMLRKELVSSIGGLDYSP